MKNKKGTNKDYKMLCSDEPPYEQWSPLETDASLSMLKTRDNPRGPRGQNKNSADASCPPLNAISHDKAGSSTGRRSRNDLFLLFPPLSSPFQETLLRGPGKSCGMGIKKEPFGCLLLLLPSREPPRVWLLPPLTLSEDRLLPGRRAPSP